MKIVRFRKQGQQLIPSASPLASRCQIHPRAQLENCMSFLYFLSGA